MSEILETNGTSTVDLRAIDAIIVEHKSLPGAMLPILHAIQEKEGYIPAEAVPLVAEHLNVSRAEVHGVVSYYHFFRQHPVAKHTVQICRAEACQAMGVNALIDHAKNVLGCDFHETSKDGQITLEPVYCLGMCGCAPSVMVGDDVHARMTTDKFDQLVATLRGNQ